ncbi:Uncharacterised protein [Lacrimispora sphenoides]|uniref:Uncharacterized protein n=1 Tax=Lacrimispora sphenoides JCM 1415 TaxID=1297793 RepID=A0ABY1CAP0_9FIRM|nr:hypothetical protein SAMN02745906_2495 [[Clostridium] sphenoides JCM 1415]SUY51844.1 Uncharacterised protein [Lacrimispora sphenoides]
MLNSNNRDKSYQDCLTLGLSLGLIFAAVINNLGIGLIMGISLSLLFRKSYFQKH